MTKKNFQIIKVFYVLIISCIVLSCGVDSPSTNYIGNSSEDALPANLSGVFSHENFGIAPCQTGVLTIAFKSSDSCFYSWTTDDSTCTPNYRGNICNYDPVEKFIILSQQEDGENSSWELKRKVSFRNNQLIIKGQSGYIYLKKIVD